MLVLIVGIFYTWIAYGKAKEKNRSPIRWAVIAAATFLGTQIIIGFVIGLGEGVWWSEGLFETHQIYITPVSLLACVLTNWLALRPLYKAPKESFTMPPSPPTFDQKNVN
jgi:heme A synthase